jgi:hypothetical protein
VTLRDFRRSPGFSRLVEPATLTTGEKMDSPALWRALPELKLAKLIEGQAAERTQTSGLPHVFGVMRRQRPGVQSSNGLPFFESPSLPSKFA